MAPSRPRTVNIRELVTLLRSKNAGPAYFGFDLIFKDEQSYELAKKHITRERIAALYGVAVERVADLVPYDPGMGIKITIQRPAMSGAPDDTDVYGAQQHVPLLSLELTDFMGGLEGPPNPPALGHGPGNPGRASTPPR